MFSGRWTRFVYSNRTWLKPTISSTVVKILLIGVFMRNPQLLQKLPSSKLHQNDFNITFHNHNFTSKITLWREISKSNKPKNVSIFNTDLLMRLCTDRACYCCFPPLLYPCYPPTATFPSPFQFSRPHCFLDSPPPQGHNAPLVLLFFWWRSLSSTWWPPIMWGELVSSV